MKKVISLLLVVLLAVGGFVFVKEQFFNTVHAGTANRVTLVADPEITNKIDSSNLTFVAAFNNLTKSIKSVKADTSNMEEIALIETGLKDGNTGKYSLYHNGSSYYLQNQSNSKIAEIKSETLEDLTSIIADDLYKFANVPVASYKGTDLPIAESEYSYTGIDNKEHIGNAQIGSGSPSFDMDIGENFTPIFTDLESDNTTLSLTYNDNIVWNGKITDLDKFVPEETGSYVASITADFRDKSSNLYNGIVKYKATLNYEKPIIPPEFSISNSSSYPGELAVITAKNIDKAEDIKFETNLDFQPNFFKQDDDTFVALMPLSYRNNPGQYFINISSGETKESFAVTLNDKAFQIQNLVVDETTTSETIQSKEANEEYERVIAPLRTVAHDQAYWKGTPFVWPVPRDSRVTTHFGMIRYVNGSPTSVRHGAIDFAVPLGTPVNATNNGEVLYAGFLKLTGYTIVIEHGYGLKSWHYHLDSINVSTGDKVTAGQLIGKVGSTGFSTGAHLHFGFSINNVFVNPVTVIDSDLLD